MKKLKAVLLTVMFLCVSSCLQDESEMEYAIADALKISTWVFDESVEGNVFNTNDTVYSFECLKLHENKKLALNLPKNTRNISIFIEFDGIVEIISEDNNTQLSRSNALAPWYREESEEFGRTFGYKMEVANQGYVSVAPLPDKFVGTTEITHIFDHLVESGTVYYLDINAYSAGNEFTPRIKARLKLESLEDSTSRIPNESDIFSIELVSYEYSDMDKMMYGLE